MALASVSVSAMILRIGLAVIGGYAATTGAAALAGLALPATGMSPSESVLLATMLGFPLYLALIVWAFHERSLARVVAVIGGGAFVTICAAMLLAPPAL